MTKFQLKRFQKLQVDELYAILRLRAEVFVVEQDCPYLDLDDLDQDALHLSAWDDGGMLSAYARILVPGSQYKEYPSIGRVVTNPKTRGSGLGKKLMEEAILQCEKEYPGKPIKISAQVYLIEFYRSLNFKVDGETYLEDGIPHVGMIRA